jgi:predicted RNA-binding protein YlqC (UPF0109 family)
MKELVHFLAQQLVNNPDAVEVTEAATLLELRVAKEDLGRVIGKQGRTALSIRSILHAVAVRNNRKVTLEIGDRRTPRQRSGVAELHGERRAMVTGRVDR